MNWTGGNLSRRSRGRAAALLNEQQKAHFAMAQNNLRNGTRKRSPIKWSIFGKAQVHQADQEQKVSFEPRVRREFNLPLILDRPRYIDKGYPRNRDNHPIRTCETQHTRKLTPEPAKEEHTRDDDLYNATPPRVNKRNREPSASANLACRDIEVDFVFKKRQRLLEKGDWVGITYQRPLQLTFTSPGHARNVAKRRRLTDGHQVRYVSRQATLLSPFVARARPSSSQKFDQRGQSKRTDVRIYIGDRAVTPCFSSSTAPSRKTRDHSPPRQIRQRSHVPSSDVMLLDNNEVLRVNSPLGVNRTPFDDRDAEISRTRSYRERPCPYPENGHFQDERDSGDRKSDRDEQSGVGEEDQYFDDNYVSTQDHHNYSSQEVDYPQHVAERSVAPIAIGTPFSPTSIRHPKPQSSRVSSILRSGSSDFANSTVAQVGKLKPTVPSSQVLENELWENWMAPLFNEAPFCGQLDEEGVEQERLISPGISTALARRFYRPASRLCQERHREVRDGGFSEADKASRIVNPSIPDSSSNEDETERREPPRNVLTRKTVGYMKNGRVEDRMLGFDSLTKRSLATSILQSGVFATATETRMNSLAFPPSNHETAKKSLGTQLKYIGKNNNDPEDLWRQFVFGSDETDQAVSISNLMQSLGTRKIHVSPVRGNPSTSISANSPAYYERQSQNTFRPESGPQSHTPIPGISINFPTYNESHYQNTPHRLQIQSHNLRTVYHPDSSSIENPWDPSTVPGSATYTTTTYDGTSLDVSEHPLNLSHSEPVLATPSSRSKSLDGTVDPMVVVSSSQSGASSSSDTRLSPETQESHLF